jgi:hypothetical protein
VNFPSILIGFRKVFGQRFQKSFFSFTSLASSSDNEKVSSYEILF